jgi:hypothetical protein
MCCSRCFHYTCPRCATKTCSLYCVKEHKARHNCSGERDRTKYIAIGAFSDLDLLNDYQVLEEMTRKVNGLQDDDVLKATAKRQVGTDGYPRGPQSSRLPQELNVLRNWCRRCGATRLLFLPPEFERSKRNTTRLDKARAIIQWNIQIVFPHAEMRVLELEGVDDTTSIHELIRAYVEPDNSDEDDSLLPYRAAGLGGITVLLKAEHEQVKAGKLMKRFHEVDLRKSIRFNLCERTIVEHPILYVVLSHHAHYFEYEEISEPISEAAEGHNARSVDWSEQRILNKRKADEMDNEDPKTFGLFTGEEDDGDLSSADEVAKRARPADDAARAEAAAKREAARRYNARKEENEGNDNNDFVNRHINHGDNPVVNDWGAEAPADVPQNPKMYQQYYDYYMKYYKQKYGIADQKKVSSTNPDKDDSSAGLAALAGYGGSDSEENSSN